MAGPSKYLLQARDMLGTRSKLLAPLELLGRCRSLAGSDARLGQRNVGTSGKGHPIPAFGTHAGLPAILVYGFPDPGEAVGGTVIIALLEALLNGAVPPPLRRYDWWFVPVLNLDQQHDEGHSLGHVFRNPNVPDVDWCADEPRPETTAIVTLAEQLRPVFTFALHDDLPSEEDRSAYCATSAALPFPACREVRAAFESGGQVVHRGIEHPDMGSGFFDMNEAADYEKSTFSRFAQYGTVFIPEVSFRSALPAIDLAATQLAAVLAVVCESPAP